MNHKEQNIQILSTLKLHGMLAMYKSLSIKPIHEQLSLEEALVQMLLAEANYRSDKRTQMFLRMSKLRYDSVLEKVYCNTERNLTKEQLRSLADCSFIERAENILITGATGSGKSYLACALGRQACCLGYKTEYWGMLRLVQKIQQSKLDGTFMKFIDALNKIQLLIIDDFGLVPTTNELNISLFQILEDRFRKKSMIVASQLPLEKWYEYINDKTLADAIMDRLAVSMHKINLKGENLRHENPKNYVFLNREN
jgi:DNA replication protein DnaC